MKTVLTWLWLVPVPLCLGLDILAAFGLLTALTTVAATVVSAVVLIRTRLTTRTAAAVSPGTARLLLIVVAVLVAAQLVLVVGSGISITVLWLSLVVLAVLGRVAVSPLQITGLVVLAVAAVLAPGLAAGFSAGDGFTFAFGASTGVIAALALGLLLRMVDRSLIERHATAVADERRRIATELHDMVAHEVTGIVVLSQAAARSDYVGILHTALGKIEESGTRALEEIRALVSATHDDAAAARTPVTTGRQGLLDRVEAFRAAGGTAVTVDLDASLAEAVPGPVWAVLDRVLVESLTNIRRHAGTAVPVTIGLTADDITADRLGAVVLTIANAPGAEGIGRGSGSGLIGLRHRVEGTGGTLTAGPVAGGWEVRARIPLTAPIQPTPLPHPKEPRR